MEQPDPFPRDQYTPHADPQVEQHFCQLYQQDFAPFIQPLSHHEATKIVAATTAMVPEALQQTVAKNVMESCTSISTTEANSLMNLKLEPSWHWNEIYATLETLKHDMALKIRECLGLDVAINDTNQTANNFLTFGEVSPTVTSVPLVTSNCYQDRGSVMFFPDCIVNPVKLHHLNEYAAGDTYDDDDELIDDNNLLSGVFLLVSEGLCHWSRDSYTYHLIFPLYSLRALFVQCFEEQRKVVETAVNTILTQERVVCYAIDRSYMDVFGRNLQQVIDAIACIFQQHHHLMFESHSVRELEGKTVIVFTGHHHKNGLCTNRGCNQRTIDRATTAESPQDQYCRDHAFNHRDPSQHFHDATQHLAAMHYDILTFDDSKQAINLSITVHDVLDGVDKVVQLERLLFVPGASVDAKENIALLEQGNSSDSSHNTKDNKNGNDTDTKNNANKDPFWTWFCSTHQI
jgi:hypothetical protein